MKLILASSSPYRKALLARLRLPFSAISPDIDETPQPDETPDKTTQRLAADKALKVAKVEPQALIVGSDQLATLDGAILGKPGTHERAVQQLQKMSGQCVRFDTGLCLLNAETGNKQVNCVAIDVYFRTLTDDEIKKYLTLEEPYQCAGSFRSEQFGITLVERMEGPDPTALIGLPLISLQEMLRNEGIKLP